MITRLPNVLLNSGSKTQPQRIFSFLCKWNLILIAGCLLHFGALGQSVTVTAVSSSSMCAGSSVTLTLTAVNGTGASAHYTNSSSFQAFISDASGITFSPIPGTFNFPAATFNGGDLGSTTGLTQSISIPSGLSTSGNYKIAIGSIGPDVNGLFGANAFTNLTINQNLTASVGIVSNRLNNTFCSDSDIEFTADNPASITNPLYQWQVNGLNVGSATSTNTFIPTSFPTNPFVVSVVLSSTVTPCVTPATSAGVSVSVTPTPATPTASNTGAYCVGGTIALSTPTVSGATYSWTGPNSFASTEQNPTIPGATVAMAGAYNVTVTVNGCTSPAGSTTVVVNPIPATPSASNTGAYCVGGTIALSTPTVSGATYSWTGPNSFASTSQNPTIPGATVAMAGAYSVTVTVNGCTSPAGITNVVVNPIPAAPTASNTGAYCVGGTISLSTPTVSGATYSWSGPNSFASTAQNPTIPGATVAMAGTYNVTVTVNGCTSPGGSTTVVVNPIPAAPTASNTGAFCVGGTMSLSTPTVSGATYSWTGPNSFASTEQNPTIPGATVAMAGSYSVTVTVNGCTSPAGSTSVVVNPIPTAPTASNTGAYCVGGTISLSTPTVSGATYSWTGPNSFASTEQNPTIPGATVAMAGAYNVTVTVNGCTSPAGSTTVVVNPVPATPSASNTGAYCVGGTIALSTPTVSGATYSWTGPNSFASTSQNPTIPGATVAMAGAYSVTVTVNGCTSPAGITNVVVNPIPAAPTASNTGAYCVGGTISLSTPTVSGATYSWSGPNSFASTAQNPTIPGATVAMAGAYNVTVTVNGCTSPGGSTTVVVNPIPAAPAASNTGAYCVGGTIALSTPTVSGATYSWTGPNSFASTSQNPAIPGATVAMAGAYNITVTVNGCTSAAGSTTVVVNALQTPSVTISSTSTNICTSTPGGSTPVTFTATPTNGGAAPSYQWKLNGATNVGTNSATYVANGLPDNSVITVVMTSNAVCPSPTSVTSANSITLKAYNANVAQPVFSPAGTPDGAVNITSVCPVATGLVYTVSPDANALGYNWVLPAGWLITSGAGTNSITVTATVDVIDGNNEFSVAAINPCGASLARTLAVNVAKSAAVYAGIDTSVCAGNIITLSGDKTGYANKTSWSATSGTFSNPALLNTTYTPSITSDTVRLTLNITQTQGNLNCPVVSDVMILTIKPTITAAINVSGPNPICAGGSSVVTFTGTPNTTITYKVGIGADQFINIDAGGSATLNTGVLTTSTSYSIQSSRYTNGIGCSQSITGSATASVTTPPTAVAGTAVTTCSNAGAVNITAGSSATNTTGVTWTSTGTGTIGNANSLTLATYTPGAGETGTITLTLTATGNSPCSTAVSTKNLTITTAPTAVSGDVVTTCSNSGAVNITAGSSSFNNAGITWTSNGTGSIANANSITGATYTPGVGETGTIILTLTATANTPCSTAVSTKNLIITAAPTAVAGTAVTTCSNAGAVNITAGSSATSTTGVTWTSTGTGTIGNANSLTLATYTPGAGETGTITLTLTATGNSPCSTAVSTKNLTITTAPTAVSGDVVTTCSNSGAVNITAGSSSFNNAGITWTSNGTGSIANANSITGATYTPGVGETGTIILTLTATANTPCSTAVSTKNLIITAAPTAVAGTAVTTCSNAGAVNITAGSSATNTTGVTWTSTGTGTIGNANSLTLATYTPGAGETGTITLTLTATGNSPCSTAVSTKNLTITTAPTAVSGDVVTTCSNSGAVNITAGSSSFNNAGITWTSNGTGSIANANSITGATYTPGVGETGTIILTLTATANTPCSTAVSTKNLIITAAPTAVAGTAVTTCSNAGAVNITAGSSATSTTGVTWTSTGTGTIGNANSLTLATYTPGAGETGTITLTLTATGNSPCSTAISTKSLTVNREVSISTHPIAQTVCSSFPVSFTVAATGLGLTYQWYFNGSIINNGGTISGATTATFNISQADVSNSGIYTVEVKGTAPCSSLTSNPAVLTVNQSLSITKPTGQTVCEGTSSITFSANATGSISGYVWRKNGIPVSGSNFSGANTSTLTVTGVLLSNAGNYDVVVSGTSGSCSQVVSDTATLAVTPTVTINAFTPAASTRCQGSGTVTTTTTANNSTGITYSLDPASLAGGNTIVALTGAVTYAAGWSGTTTITAIAAGCNGPATTTHVVTVTPTVTINAFTPATSTRCQGSGTVTTTTTANNSTGITYSLDPASLAGGNTIVASTGAVTYAAGWSGTTTITAIAAGCNGPATTTHVVTVTPTVTINAFTPATSTRCQGSGTVTTTTTANNSTGITYSLDPASLAGGNTIVALTGAVTYAAGWSGTTTITASAAGCNGPATTTHVVTVTPTVTINAFTPATSTRCQGSGTVTTTTTANNSTGITYSLDPASLAGGNTIVALTGAVTYAAGWSGTTTITASAAGCNGPATTTHVVTVTPTVTINAFTPATSTRCQGSGTVTTTTTANNSTGITYSLDPASLAGGNTIMALTGAVTYAAGWSGTTTITAIAAGCNGPATTTHVVTVTPTVTINAFTPATSTRCQGSGTVTTTTTANNSTGITYSLDPASLVGGNTIVASTGAVTYAAGWSGTTTITASAAGCNGTPTTTHIVIVTPSVTINAFSPTTSERCQGAGTLTITTTATNSTGITYSLDGASITAGNTINPSTGAVTYTSTWSGLTTITASATGCNGPVITTHVVTTTLPPTAGILSVAGGTGLNNAYKTLCPSLPAPNANGATINLTGGTGAITWLQSNNGGAVWTPAVGIVSGNSLAVSDLPVTTIYRAVHTNGSCVGVYSSVAVLEVIPPYPPSPVTATPSSLCLGESAILTAATGIPPAGISSSTGDFDQGTHVGWVVDNNPHQSAGGNNRDVPYWQKTNNHTFPPSVVEWDSHQNKFTIVHGANNSVLVSPPFSLVGQQTASLSFIQAFILDAGAWGKIDILVNGVWVNVKTYTGALNFGLPATFATETLDLSSYIGQSNLKLRFDYHGTTNSTWALDGLSTPGVTVPVGYTWTGSILSNTTGSPVTATPTAVGPNTFYITTSINNCPGSTPQAVTITVYPVPAIDQIQPVAACVSTTDQTVNLPYTGATFSPGSYSITWAAPANGLQPVNDVAISPLPNAQGSGNVSFTVPANMTPGTYIGTLVVRNSNNGTNCNSIGRQFTFTVNPLPAAPAVTPATICDPGPITVNATPTAGSTIDWYAAATGGTALAIGTTSYSIANLAITTTYYAQSRNTTTGCISTARTAVIATVNAPGAITVDPVTDAIGCIGSPTTLTGSGTGTGANYQWEMSTDGGSNWSNVPNAAPYNGTKTGTLSISSVTIEMSTYLYRLALATPPPCNIVARSQDIHIKIRNVWMGYVSTDWNDGANWSDGLVPSYICDDVHILNQANDPILNSVGAPTPPITNLRIYPGANLTLANGSIHLSPMTGAKLRVRGHIYKDPSATFNAITGTLEMIGGDGNYAGAPGAQTLDANTFTNNALGNLIVNNSGTLTLNGAVDIYESVEYGSVGNNLATNNFLTLKSMPALTARMGMLTGKTISGHVTVERYLPAKAAWRFLSVPTHGSGQTIHDAWQEGRSPLDPTPAGYGTNIEGPENAAGGFDAFAQRHGMKYFHKDEPDGYRVVTNTNAVISQTPALGYMVFVRGDRSVINGEGSTTLRTKGLLFRDNLSFYVDPAVGFNSVGNPYASRIDLRSIVKNGTYVDAFTIWNPDLSGLYGVGGYETLTYDGPSNSYINNVSSTSQNLIESGQAFYIQTNTTPGTVNLTETVKTFGSDNVSFAPNGEPEVSLRMKLVSKPGNQPEYTADGILMTFSTGYKKELDNNDVKKLFNNSDNLAVFSADTYLVAERSELPRHGDTIHLFLYATRQQDYRFDFEPIDLQKLKVQPYLYDGFLQTYQAIDLKRKSSVNFSIGADAASRAMDRFKIVFRKVQKKNILITEVHAGRKQDRTIAINWKVENESDVKQYEIERSADGLLFTGIITTDATGNNNTTVAYVQTDIGPLSKDNYYRIKATQNDGVIVYSEIVKVDALPEPATTGEREIRAFPNPVIGKRLQLTFTNQPAGKYQVQVVNHLGQVVQNSTVTVQSDNQKQMIQLGSSVLAGQYQLSITAPDGSKTLQSIFVE